MKVLRQAFGVPQSMLCARWSIRTDATCIALNYEADRHAAAKTLKQQRLPILFARRRWCRLSREFDPADRRSLSAL